MKKRLAKMILVLILLMTITSCTYSRSIQNQANQATNPVSWIIDFYRGPLDHLSAVRYGECPMYPSDSEYGLQSIQKHGMLIGWIMAMDRLMRSGRDEIRLAPKILINGKWKSFDPVESNDFWWSDK
jgi:putative component of membrane protein insertase Oxa1/YidC/SpoIIIJ protein YidD